MREIGAFEAKNKLGTLLDWVENGEEVLITRTVRLSHGWCRLNLASIVRKHIKPYAACSKQAGG